MYHSEVKFSDYTCDGNTHILAGHTLRTLLGDTWFKNKIKTSLSVCLENGKRLNVVHLSESVYYKKSTTHLEGFRPGITLSLSLFNI